MSPEPKALLNNTALTGVTTVPAVTDWTAYQAVRAKDADARYLRLSDAKAQEVSGSVTFSGNLSKDAPAGANAQIQVTSGGSDRWNFGRDGTAESGTSTGSNFVIARFDNSGNYIDTPLSISRETGVASANNGMEVPDITEFTGKDALNAETAEGRYIKSVPAAGQTRITDLVENADGRAVFGAGTNNPVLALLSDLPMDDPAMKLQAFYVTPDYGQSNPARVSFPRAFKPGTVPVVMFPNTMEMGPNGVWISNVIQGNRVNGVTTKLLVDNEGFSIGGYVIGGEGAMARFPMIIPVFAAGYYA